MLILVIFQALYIPLTVSFEIVHDYASGWWNFDLITDLMFMLDLIMTFNVAIVENNTNKLILSRKRIAKHYLTGWFWLDLAASIPFDLLLTLAATGTLKASSNESAGAGVGSATSLLKGFKLPRLLRLLKVMRIMRLVKLAKIRPEVSRANPPRALNTRPQLKKHSPPPPFPPPSLPPPLRSSGGSSTRGTPICFASRASSWSSSSSCTTSRASSTS